MKYLVTGGAGFIGSHFIRHVLRQDQTAQVTNLDLLTYAGNLDSLKDCQADPRYRFIQGDIRDPQAVDPLVADCEVVVNFAAETHVDRSIQGPAEFVRTNVFGTQVLLDAAVRHRKRFHHISTDEVFGSLALGSAEKFRADTPYDPRSPYAASKAGSDHLVRAYAETFGLAATISNCSNNYGPNQHPEKLIPLMIINAMHGRPLPVYGDGRNVRDWIHVTDHAAAIDLIIKRGRTGETYLVGGNAERANLDIVKKILEILGKGEELIKFVPDRPGHDRRYAIDSSKIENELNFVRQYDFEDGLRQTVDWYAGNRQWWQPILSGEYQNYYRRQYRL